uniref:SAP domain-containing ribonucleoprotein-like n=1 Tax=Oncorhynchus kisutch TaxID=8019 RepID=A0A8C7CMD4_ONCKI
MTDLVFCFVLAELKQECAVRGLAVKGNKGDLIGRLQAYLEEHDEVNEEEVLGELEDNPKEEEISETPAEVAVEKAAVPEKDAEKKVVKITAPSVVDEVLKKRAERFGMNVSSVAKTVEVDEKLKKRKERFGILTAAAVVGAEDSEVKKRKRADRFGNN